jgi:hypothetical protein
MKRAISLLLVAVTAASYLLRFRRTPALRLPWCSTAHVWRTIVATPWRLTGDCRLPPERAWRHVVRPVQQEAADKHLTKSITASRPA